MRARAFGLGILVLVLAGCSSLGTPTPTASDDPASLVVLGDSLSLQPPPSCDGCTSWVTQVADSMGPDTVVHDDALADAQLADVEAALNSDDVQADLTGADAVVVWIGYNEGPPWNEDTPCATKPGDTVLAQVEAVESYSSECIAETMTLYRQRYADLFARIGQLSPGATAHSAVTIFSNWRDNPGLKDPGLNAERIDAVLIKTDSIFTTWNAGLCDAAVESDWTCIDLAAAVNGADGRTPVTEFVGSDFTHLSQAGHSLLAGLSAGAGDAHAWGAPKRPQSIPCPRPPRSSNSC